MDENNRVKLRAGIKSSLPLVYLILALFALRWTVVEPYVVPTGSMEPTLKPGDRLYALKCAYDVRFPFTNWIIFKTGDVKRGDVILFQAPKNPKVTYVKRAIGLPGDKIKVIDGTLFVNGNPMQKTVAPNQSLMRDLEQGKHRTLFIEDLTGVRHYMTLYDFLRHPEIRNFPEIEIPEGHLFAVGDNRDNSHDSRAWGFVPYQNLKGRAMFIWFSSWNWIMRPQRIGTIIQ